MVGSLNSSPSLANNSRHSGPTGVTDSSKNAADSPLPPGSTAATVNAASKAKKCQICRKVGEALPGVCCCVCGEFLHWKCRGITTAAGLKLFQQPFVRVTCDDCTSLPIRAENSASDRLSVLEEKFDKFASGITQLLSNSPNFPTEEDNDGQSWAQITAKGIRQKVPPSVRQIREVVAGDVESRRIVISGLPENGNDAREAQQLCHLLDQSATVVETFRLGQKRQDGRSRLLKVTFASSTVAKSVLLEARQLRGNENYKMVFVRRSMSSEERKLFAKLVVKRNELNQQSAADEKYVIVGEDTILHYVNCEVQSGGSLGKGTLDKDFVFNPEELRNLPIQSKNGSGGHPRR